ncbi:hypothetical protein LINPERPRIM_LOCUS2092 [Linum perenne]
MRHVHALCVVPVPIRKSKAIVFDELANDALEEVEVHAVEG